jgi:hypothetical protein
MPLVQKPFSTLGLHAIMEEDDKYEVPRANVDRGDPEVMEDQQHGDGASITDSEVSVESSGLRRSVRASKPVDRYQGHQKQVAFADKPAVQKKLEEVYNIALKPGSKKTWEYGQNAVQVAEVWNEGVRCHH